MPWTTMLTTSRFILCLVATSLILAGSRTLSAEPASFDYGCRIGNPKPNADDCDSNAVRDDCERPGLQFSRLSIDVPGTNTVRASAAFDKRSVVVATDEFLFVVDQVATQPVLRSPLALPPASRTGEWVKKILAADFNGDNRDDLVVVRDNSIVLVASQNGGFASPRLLDVTGTGARDVYDVAIVGGPGRRSLAISTGQAIWEIASPFASTVVARQGPSFVAAKLVAIDIDGDGSDEVAATLNGVTHLLRSGTSGMTESGSFPAARAELKVADVDGDGDLDLVGATQDSHAAVFYVNASGSFTPQISSYRTDWRTTDHVFGIFRTAAGERVPVYGEHSRVWLGVSSPDVVAPQFLVPATDVAEDLNGDGLVDFAGIRSQRLEVSVARMAANTTMASCDVDTFSPTGGGNNGRLTVIVRGKNLLSLEGAELVAPALPPITAVQFSSSTDGRRAAITFPLYGATPGQRRLRLKLGAQVRTLPADFEVREGTECRGATFNLIGPGMVRTGRDATVSVFYTNPCDVDVENVLLWLDLPQDVTVVDTSPTTWPPTLGPDPGGEVAIVTDSSQRVGALEPLLPPGGSGSFSVKIKPQQSGDVRVSLAHAELTDLGGVPFAPSPSVGADGEFGALADRPAVADGEAIGKCMAAVGEHLAKKIGEGVVQGLQEHYPGECVAGFAGHVYKIARYAWKEAHHELADASSAKLAFTDIGVDLAKASLKCATYAGKNYPIVKYGSAVLKAAAMAVDGYKLWKACKENAGAIDGVLHAVASKDPNDIVGPADDCTGGISVGSHSFVLRFENAATATASARSVRIELILANLDARGMRVSAIGLGGRTFTFDRLGEQDRLLDLRPWVSQSVAFNARRSNDRFVMSFSSFDVDKMTTSADPTAGFLAPNRSPPDGEGYVIFSVSPVTGATEASAAARITFDDNPPIDTNRWSAKVLSAASCKAASGTGKPGASSGASDAPPPKSGGTTTPTKKTGCGCTVAGRGVADRRSAAVLMVLVLAALRLLRARHARAERSLPRRT